MTETPRCFWRRMETGGRWLTTYFLGVQTQKLATSTGRITSIFTSDGTSLGKRSRLWMVSGSEMKTEPNIGGGKFRPLSHIVYLKTVLGCETILGCSSKMM